MSVDTYKNLIVLTSILFKFVPTKKVKPNYNEQKSKRRKIKIR